MSDKAVSISVIMPVYNVAEYVAEAVNSILQQTFGDFEFIIIDDCSTDNTYAILQQFNDPRIRLFKGETNLGLTRNLNIALDKSMGKYIARMDGDDVALNTRFEKQFHFMENNPAVGLCGTWYELFGAQSKEVHYKVQHDEIVLKQLYQCHVAHSSVMIRKSVLDQYGLRYNEEYQTAQDYELWPRISRVARLHTLPEMLFKVRIHSASVSKRLNQNQLNNALKIRTSNFSHLGVGDITPGEIDIYTNLMHQEYAAETGHYDQVESLLLRMVQGNEKTHTVREDIFNKHITDVWYNYNYNALGKAGAPPFGSFLSSPLTKKYFNLPWILKARIKAFVN